MIRSRFSFPGRSFSTVQMFHDTGREVRKIKVVPLKLIAKPLVDQLPKKGSASWLVVM